MSLRDNGKNQKKKKEAISDLCKQTLLYDTLKIFQNYHRNQLLLPISLTSTEVSHRVESV